MRYVIVCLISGDALKFHEKLVTDVCNKFNVTRQKLPGHFTIKAPFETENIEEIESMLDNFSKVNNSFPMDIKDFGHFRDSVIFMNVNLSEKAKKVHNAFIDELKNIKWLDWKPNERKNKIFHCTIVTKLKHEKFIPIWSYTSELHCDFKCNFDNITIMKWDKNKWVVYKKFNLININ